MTDPKPDRPRSNPTGRKPGDDSAEWMRLAALGFEFIVAVLLVGGAGWLLDGWLNSTPWLLITGVGLGFALGLWLLIREARRVFHD